MIPKLEHDLRDIVRRYAEEITLKDFFGENYTNTPQSEKERMLDFLRNNGDIERTVERTLKAFLDDIEK